jgi:Eukaryotic translation initiation factor 3 subunit 8 N-terminus
MHINDWSAIQTLFDRLNKQLEKIMKTAPGLGVPRAYARILAELEDFLVKFLADKAARKKVCIPAAWQAVVLAWISRINDTDCPCQSACMLACCRCLSHVCQAAHCSCVHCRCRPPMPGR